MKILIIMILIINSLIADEFLNNNSSFCKKNVSYMIEMCQTEGIKGNTYNTNECVNFYYNLLKNEDDCDKILIKNKKYNVNDMLFFKQHVELKYITE